MKRHIRKMLAALLGVCIIAGNTSTYGSISHAAPESEAAVQEDGTAEAGEQGQTEGVGSTAGEAEGTGEAGAGAEAASSEESQAGQTGDDTTAPEQAEEQENTSEEAGIAAQSDDSTETASQESQELKENSWRYQDGNLIENYEISSRAGYANAWKKVNGVYMNDNGQAIIGAKKKGIDVSEHQGNIDWAQVKADGIDFAIIRCGYGNDSTSQDDKKWLYNVSECERLGIPYGVYIYSYATDTSMAKSEAQHVLRLISGKSLSYPVYFDMEDNSTKGLSNDMKGQIAKTFCDTITAAGYQVGVYANLDWWTNHLTSSVFNNSAWSKWVAQYNSTCDYAGTYEIWQCTSKGSVAGISGNVDLNFLMDESVEDNGTVSGTDANLLSFSAYMQSFEWLDAVQNGGDAGMAGYSKRLEAFKISVGSGYGDLGVKYSALVQDDGWQDYVSDGAVAGTTGQSKAVQAVKIELTGSNAANYDIYYRVHAQTYGWMGWAKNGEAAGSEGYGKRLEALQIAVVPKGQAAPGSTDNAFKKKEAGVSYQSYVNGQGWQAEQANGAMSGTSEQARSIEALKVQLNLQQYSGDVVYNTYMQSYGWQTEQSNNAVSGLPGQNKRMEAVTIKLTGEMEQHFDIYYRTYVQTYGWLGWAKNGEKAGTSDFSKRLEGIEIRLVEKGGAAPGDTSNAFKHRDVLYQTHMQTYGWTGKAADGKTGGVTGQAKRMEAVNIYLSEQKYAGDIQYKTHVQTYGWQDWVENGADAGTVGLKKRLEAIQIKLTGEMEENYDIYYRVHVQTYGWLDWAKNGDSAGTEGLAKRLEAIQIKLVPKGEAAPGSTDRAFIK
ncbi:GH25 family lysozyme [Luxibacter massiliensis]|uniref:GH25 family lysozyme n=1 Tax=Luxibacter massiliensis TaxID=2219695 RepID=UPI000F0571E6|nr:GH25 family lysozyme [Luxibacter massiliensis]